MQPKHKQILNSSRRKIHGLQRSGWVSPYTNSENHLQRRYKNRHSISMFIGTPCIIQFKTTQDKDFYQEKYQLN